VTVLLAVLRYGLWFQLPAPVVVLTMGAVLWATAVTITQDACDVPLQAVVQVGATTVLAIADVFFAARITATALTALCVGAANLLPLLTDSSCLYAGSTVSALLTVGLGWRVFNDAFN